MTKLQKRFAYEYNAKKHYKHIVTIPEDVLKELGWKDGIDLEQKVEDSKLVFTANKKRVKGSRFES